MNFTKNSLLFFVLFMISTFMPYKNYDLDINKAASTNSLVSTDDEDLIDNDCFDQKMETWFIAFNHYQSLGYKMEIADEMAVADANDEYENCNGDVNLQIASLVEE